MYKEDDNEFISSYERLLLKLRKNNVSHTPYLDGNVDLQEDTSLKEFALNLKKFDKDKANMDGTSAKIFTRLDDSCARGERKTICDSKYFGDLITELRNNPDCSYRTIYNDLISKENYIPRYFSVLLKDCHNDSSKVKAELFGSRLANLLGVPTAYYIGIKDNTPKSERMPGEIIDDYFAVASVDFVPYNHTMETFKDLTVGRKYQRIFENVGQWIGFIEDTLSTRFDGNVDKSSLKILEEDFIKSYLFRVALFPDYDFAVYNMGAVIDNDTNKFFLTPNFDMEAMMFEHLYQPYGMHYMPNKSKIKKTIKYCNEKFPDVISDFMNKLENSYLSGEIERVAKETLGTTGSKSIVSDISIACKNMSDCYNNPAIKFRDYLPI